MQLIVAEKPSVARDLARVLGVRPAGRGAFEGSARVISWCVGHLVELDEPAAYDARWKAWRLDTLPMLPERFKLRPVASARDQLTALRALLRDRRFSEVVNACDAGREGELIFRYVYELAGCRLPVRRLWISSLTDEAVRRGFDHLRPGAEYDALADAARCRSEADWLVGLNATRAVTVRHRNGPDSPLYSIGRVQTPTLALLVGREKAIQGFQPRDYWEVRGTFLTPSGERFEALFAHGRRTRLSQADAAALLERLAAHAGGDDPQGPLVEKVQQRNLREPPPLLFDLTSLQRTANRRFGLSASRTLEIAQALYETHKILTYPRTDSRYLTRDLAATVPRLLQTLEALPDYAGFARRLLAAPEALAGVNRRIFDDGKVEDHHAIIPTGKAVDLAALSRDERNVFDLVARRFLGAFFPDAEFALAEAIIRVGEGTAPPPAEEKIHVDPPRKPDDGMDSEPLIEKLPPPPDRFRARGRVRLAAGWQEVAGFGAAEEAGGPKEAALPPLTVGQRLDGTFASVRGQTRPPPRYSEGTLLAAMETAGRGIEDEDLRRAMKDTGLGTPATRAATIETLIKRAFVRREGKTLHPTPTGIALVDALPVPSLSSPELTGSWEARLARIARGGDRRDAFMRDIARYVSEIVEAIRSAPANPAMAATAPARERRPSADRPPAPPPLPRPEPARPRKTQRPRPAKAVRERAPAELECPGCKQGRVVAGNRGWGCSRWREGCKFVIWFETAGKRLTEAQLRELIARGKTRKLKAPQPGRFVLDLAAERPQGAARFQPEPD